MRSEVPPGRAGGDWTEPRRLHPSTLLFSGLRVARGFLFPAILGGLSAGGDDPARIVGWTLVILAVPALLLAVARYAAFRYRLPGDELVLDSGVLRRRRRVIPLARVQNVDVRQNGLERLWGVAEVRVETAGGRRTEAVLGVLARAEAEALRRELLARRRVEAGGGAAAPEPAAEVLARLDTGDLVLAGATANEAGIIAAGLLGLLQMLDDLPVPLPAPRLEPEWLGPLPTGVAVAAVAAAAVLILVFLGWVLSILGAVVGYHDFTLERVDDALRKRYGWISRREATVPLERVQAVRVEESLLRRPLGLASLRIDTAGAAPGRGEPGRRGGAEAFVPLARTGEVAALVAAVFPGLDYDALAFHPVHPRSRRRVFTRYTVPLLLATGGLVWFAGPAGLLLLALLPLAALLARWQYRHRGYARAPGFVVARSGVWNRVTWIVPERRVQTLHVRATPFQRRHGLATLGVDTAAGGRRSEARVVDLGRDRALELLERLARAAGGRPEGECEHRPR